MVDSDVGEVLRYPNAIFTTERHGTDLELLKIMDMTDQGHEESALFTRRNAVEASPMSDNTTSDSFVSDGQMNEQEDKTSHSNLETIGAQTIQIPDENTNMDNQMNEQQDDENSQSNLETIEGQTIQILDGNTNMDFEEESLKQRQMTDKQISIEITEEQLRDTDIQLREGLMKETGVVFTEKTSQQNDHGNHVTVSRESSMDFTEETSNQDSDSVPDQLDDTIEESMDEDKTQSVKTLKVRPLFLGEKIRLGKEMKMLGQLVNERRQKKKKKAHKEVDTGKQPEQEIKDDKDFFREETIYHRLITEPATQASLSSEMTSSVISKEIPSSNVTDDNRPADPDRKKPNTQNQDKKKPEKRKMKEEEADGTVDNPKKKKKTGGKWSEHKREQAKLLKAAQLTKREERLRRERVRERLKELEERYHQVDNKDSEDTEQADEGTDKLPEDSSMVNKAAVHIPVLKRYILEENRETKEVLIEIDPVLLAKLKPHQVEAVRFMYDCCIESVDIVEFDQGGGCILAHCMGLGKTLSVISFVYTLMSKSELTTIKKSLIVCPLNTVKNWVNEFQKWTSDLIYEINVYELSNVKESKKRGEQLKKWYNEGGVMILGYEMYRNLVQAGRGKVRVQKETYTEVLADPGPDLVICDEGHILKNSKSLQYKAMNRIRTRRRVILTGTPLQNNLKEYYHMVNYVKPLLLSTMKNFTKRFINPITAGQCKDSSQSQIDDMRRRVHVLHKILGGCVQRKDYSALTKFLPPKHEYVISVRMGTKQCALYQKYLCKTEKYLYMTGFNGVKKISGRDARLFRDYQTLMRIWTHPWLLTRKREKKESKVSKSQMPTYIREPTADQSPVTIKNTESVDCFVNKSAKLCMDVQSVNTESGLDVQNVKIKPGLDLQNMETDSSMDKENIEPGFDVQDVKREPYMDLQYDAKENKKDIRRVDSDSPPHLDPVGEVSTLEENLDREVPRDERNGSPFDSSLSRSEQTFPVIKPEYEEMSNSSWPVKPDEASNISDEEHSPSTFMEYPPQESPDIPEVLDDWWREHVTDDDGMNMSMSGKIMLLFEILDMCRLCKDKLLVFSQSIPSLNLIEGFLSQQTKSSSMDTGKSKVKKTWIRDKDYFRIDGTTSAQKRKEVQKSFNDPENDRACLFLISTKAGSLGTNLVAANRVIIFDASWNPSHDVQSIFRVYRFGQVKPVYVYRFLAQGTMEEKIYERQVTKQSLSQRVIDEQQIERHFTAADLQALYEFKPDRLDDPNREHRPLPNLPKDELLANLMTSQKQWIVTFHEHDSLLENIEEEELTEEEKEAAWSEYERKALHIVKPVSPVPFTGMNLDDQAQSSPGHQFLTNSDSEDLPNIGSVDLDAWFEKPANTELLSALGDMIKEKYPDILMQDDLNPEIPRQDLPQDSLDSQNSFGHLPYQPDQRDINDQQVETFAAGKNDLMVNYDNMVQGPSTSRYGSSFAAGIRPHQDYSYNLGRHDATSVTDSVKEAPQPSSGVTANENISKNSVNTSEQLLSVGNPLDVAKTFPDTEPLDLSFVEDLSPINMYKETRAERDLNTPELIITDEQRSESNSDTRGWIGDTYHIPKSYYSSSVGMSYKKPKQRMLQRLLLETMDTSTPTFTFSDEQSFGTVSPPQSMQETTPLNLSSRDTAPPIQQTVPLNLSVRDTPMQAPLIPAILTLTDSLSVDSTDYTLNDVESTSTSSVGLDTDTLNNSSETHTLTGDGNQETRSTDKVSTDSRFSSVIQLDSNTLFNSSETSTLKGDGSQEILITTHPVSSDSNTSSIIKLDTDTLSNSSETNIKGSGKREILKTDQVFSDSGSYSLTHLDTDTHSNSSAFQDDDNEKLNITDQVSSDSTSSSSSVTELDTDTHSNSSETGVVNSDIIQDIHETDQTTRNSTSSPVIQLETDTPLYLSHKSLPKGDEDAETAVSPTSADVPDSIKEVNSAADEQFDDLQELNIPSVVLENTVLRQESVTTDTHMKSSSFSPIKTDEYEDISDSEEDL